MLSNPGIPNINEFIQLAKKWNIQSPPILGANTPEEQATDFGRKFGERLAEKALLIETEKFNKPDSLFISTTIVSFLARLAKLLKTPTTAFSSSVRNIFTNLGSGSLNNQTLNKVTKEALVDLASLFKTRRKATATA